VVANCGETARTLLACRYPYLTRRVVCQLARTSPERQRFEIEEIRCGRPPFKTPTTVFDTTGYGEVGSRLARAGGFVNRAAQVTARITAAGGTVDAERGELRRVAAAQLRHCGVLSRLIVRAHGDKPARVVGNEARWRWSPPRSWDHLPDGEITTRKVLHDLRAAGAFVDKCVRDLPRARCLWPSRDQAHSCLVRLFEMITHLHRLLASMTRTANVQAGHVPGRHRAPGRIATHRRPDLDALVAVWLVERYLFGGTAEVVFLRRGHDWSRGPGVDCVVDMTGLNDPRLLLFDHKPPSRQDRGETCAARLVWEHLRANGKPVGHLSGLVDAIHGGDAAGAGRSSAADGASNRAGLHAHYDRMRGRGVDDLGLYREMRAWLNRRYRVGSAGA
jgi:hypothetical protein